MKIENERKMFLKLTATAAREQIINILTFFHKSTIFEQKFRL